MLLQALSFHGDFMDVTIACVFLAGDSMNVTLACEFSWMLLYPVILPGGLMVVTLAWPSLGTLLILI